MSSKRSEALLRGLSLALLFDWTSTFSLVFGGCCRYFALRSTPKCKLTCIFVGQQCPHPRTHNTDSCLCRYSPHLRPIRGHFHSRPTQIHHNNTWTTWHANTMAETAANSAHTLSHSSCFILCHLALEQQGLCLPYSYASTHHIQEWRSGHQYGYGMADLR